MMGAEMRIPDFECSSAGTRAVIGSPMHKDAASILAALGGDPADFRARQLTAKIAAGADLILAMTRSHRDSILELVPRQFSRTFTLTEASWLASERRLTSIHELGAERSLLSPAKAPDIEDPIGQSPEVHARIGSLIAQLLPPVIELCYHSAASA